MAVLGRKKTCPDCAERVAAAAKVCHYCGYRFDTRPSPTRDVAPSGEPDAEQQTAHQSPSVPVAPENVGVASEQEVSRGTASAGVESDEEIARYGPPGPLRAWSIAAYIGLGLIGAAIVWNIVADVQHLDFLDRTLSRSEAITQSEYDDSYNRIQAASIAYLAAYVGGGLFFIGFFHAAYTNVGRLGGRGFRFRFGQAIWPWFIPFFNLIRPKQVANDIWRGSHALNARDPTGWREADVSPLVHWWWALYLIAGAGVQITARVFQGADAASEAERSALRVDVPAQGLLLVALTLAFIVVYRITTAQQRLIEGDA
jgi:hypothetical protein